MTNPSKRKGTAFEAAVRDYLALYTGRKVRLAPDWGARDEGDLTGTEPFVFECKATKAIDLAGAVDEACTEAAIANQPWPVAVIKRRGRGTRQSYAVMPLDDFVEMTKEAGLWD